MDESSSRFIKRKSLRLKKKVNYREFGVRVCRKKRKNYKTKMSHNSENDLERRERDVEAELELVRIERENIERLRNEIADRQQQTHDDLIAQIEALRLDNQRQRETIVQMERERQQQAAQVPAPIQQDFGMTLVNGLVQKMENINSEVKLPKFNNETSMHPNKYLDKLMKYFRAKGTTENNKLEIVERSLEGRAHTWFDANVFETFDDFRTAFLNEFNSVPCQVKLKSKWLKRRYNQQDGTLQSYFYDQVSEAQFFQPKYSPYEMHYHIIQQLPVKYRDLLATVNYSDKTSIAQALGNLDAANDFRTEENKRFSNSNTNNPVVNTRPSGQRNPNLQKPRNPSAHPPRNTTYPNQQTSGTQGQVAGVNATNVFPNQNLIYHNTGMGNGEWSLPNFTVPPPNINSIEQQNTDSTTSQHLNGSAAQ